MTTSTLPFTETGLRKAAILVANLDRTAADAVLEQLGPEQARQVRQAVVSLEEIPDAERQQVIVEFFRLGPEKNVVRRSAEIVSRPPMQQQAPLPETSAERSANPPFQRLREAEGEKLARLLAGERPQTIALVLSHLASRQAGEVLVRLAPQLQVEVVRRLVNLEETDPAVLREVERALEARLSRQVQMQRRRVAGWEAIQGILETAESNVGSQILENLTAHDRTFAQRLGSPQVEFDDLESLDDAVVAEVFRAADPEWIMPALLGATPELVDRALRALPGWEAASMRQKLAQPGPIQLRDVETARRRLADLTGRILMVKQMQR